MIHHSTSPDRGSSALLLSRPSNEALRHYEDVDPQVRCYRSHFSDRMEMQANPETIATYLDQHQGWFRRGASPMEVEALDPQAYALTLGRFGNFGFEVEPTIGLRLLPRQERSYAIETVALPDHDPALAKLYDVDFQANLSLVDLPENRAELDQTWVNWTLDLTVCTAPASLHKPAMASCGTIHLLQSLALQIRML